PLAMVSPRTGAAEFVLRFPMARAAYVLEVEGSVPRDLDGVLDELLRTDSRREERRRWATYYLGDLPREGYAERFVTGARAALGPAGAGPAAPDPASGATSGEPGRGPRPGPGSARAGRATRDRLHRCWGEMTARRTVAVTWNGE